LEANKIISHVSCDVICHCYQRYFLSLTLASLQVLSMVRHVRLSSIPELSYRSLAFTDISSFTSFVAFDCIIPGPQQIHGVVKTVMTAVGLPVLLFLAATLMWVVTWGVHHIAAHAHR
jgi:hypothetical protein